MRFTDLAWGLAIGFVFPAACSQAVTLQSYAKVNLIQGAEVMMVSAGSEPATLRTATAFLQPELSTDAVPVENLQFAIFGPSDYTIKFQVGALESDSQWWDGAEPLRTRADFLHDSSGMLWLNFPVTDLVDEIPTPGYADGNHPYRDHPGEDSVIEPSRLVISVIYE